MHGNGADRNYKETANLINYGFREFTHKEVKLTKDAPTFYQLMKMDMPDTDKRIYRNEALKEKVISPKKKAYLTVPVGTDTDQLERTGDGKTVGRIDFRLDGWYVGTGAITLNPFPGPAAYPFREKRDVSLIYEAAEAKRQEAMQQASLQEQMNVLVGETISSTNDFIQNNKMTIAIVCGFILLILIILVIILIRRLTRESRLRKRRRKEERMRSLQEAEIERKSAVEIEQELRAAMAAEQKRKDEELARQQQQLEETLKLRETEELLEQINREEFSYTNPDSSRGKE